MFRLFGFDVQVRLGFVIFLGLIVMISPGRFGIIIAAALAAFTLLHELGHAWAARRAGADASISLDFLAGYTSFHSSRPLSRGQKAGITAAGPAIQIVTSSVILVALGAVPWSLDSVRSSELTYAIWWAGPVIGAINLIPVLPLDGGHLVHAALEPVLGKDPIRTMAIASIVLTVSAATWAYLSGLQGFVILVAFLLVSQFQLLQSGRQQRSARNQIQRAVDAERLAWQSGQSGMLEPGQRLSPWFQAHQRLASGDSSGASEILAADLRSSRIGQWVPPVSVGADQLEPLIALLPAELPHGNEYSARVLAEILASLGYRQRSGTYAASAFAQHRTAALAALVARAAAADGDRDNAMRWLEAAVRSTHDEPAASAAMLRRTIDLAPEFSRIRSDHDLQQLREQIESPAEI